MKLLAVVNIGQQFTSGFSAGVATNYQNLTGTSALVSLFLKLSFTFAGVILLFYFILGGIAMMSSAGKGDPKAQEQAKQTLTSAAIGFVIVFSAYWIVELIGVLTGFQDII